MSIESSDDDEVCARVDVPGRALSPSVTLYVEANEWDCDCDSPLDACEHVAAAVITARSDSTADTVGPVKREVVVAELEYRLQRTREGFYLERGIQRGDTFTVIDVPLDTVAAGLFDGPKLRAGADDLAVEKALGGLRRGLIPEGKLARVFRALSRVAVTLDGEPVSVSGDALRPVVVVDDVSEGVRMRLDEASDLTSVGAEDLPVVRPHAKTALSGRELYDLSRGRIYREEELGELVSTVLPSLRGRVAVDIRSRRLPSSRREPVRPSLTLERDGDHLYVLAGIVYGDPPVARVAEGRLVISGDAVPVRQLEAERAVAERLEKELGLAVGVGQELPTAEALAFVRRLEHFDGHVVGNGRTAFQVTSALTPHLTVGSSDFELDFSGASATAVLGAWRAGASHVALDGGGFAPLPLDWLDRVGDQVSDLLAAREASDTLPRAALPSLATLCDELELARPAEWTSLERWLTDLEEFEPPSLAPTLSGVLRDYQRDGVQWLAFCKKAGFGALLADDMGLGKTLQALCVLEKRSLVIAPTSVLQNWVEEARRFRPELSVCLYHGPQRALEASADMTVTTHALLRLDEEALASVEWDTVVIDEAQAIRNPDTALARAAFGLRARFRLCLTGTPVENRLLDVWSQLRFLNPGFLGSRTDFEGRYEKPIAQGDREALDRLNLRLRPFVKRRLKKEVAPELPPRTEITLRVELEASERAVYDAASAAARRDVVAQLGAKVSVMKALELLLRLRQAACHPGLVPGQHAESSSKVDLLVDRLRVAASEGHKSLVFSQWTSMLDRIEPHLQAEGLGFVRLDGSTRDRGAVVTQFREDSEVVVFLLSLKAGGTGLNLTAADHVFVFEPWWNPAVEEQAFDRAHRIGQEKPVFVHRLIASNTVEERILELQNRKRDLAQGATFELSETLPRDILLELLEPIE